MFLEPHYQLVNLYHSLTPFIGKSGLLKMDMSVIRDSIKISKKTDIILRPYLILMKKFLQAVSEESQGMDEWTYTGD